MMHLAIPYISWQISFATLSRLFANLICLVTCFSFCNSQIVADPLLPYLQSLKAQEAGGFNSFDLVYKSQSLQDADFLLPRVILSLNHNQRFVTFNGSPQQRGYFQTEEMEWSPVSNYKSSKGPQRFFSFTERRASENLPPSRIHTTYKCMRCHYNPLRPIRPRNSILIEAQESFKTFREEVHPHHGRYALLNLENQNQFLASDSNLPLTNALADLNARKVVGMLKEKSQCYEDMAPYLLFTLMECRAEQDQAAARYEAKVKLSGEGLKKFGPWGHFQDEHPALHAFVWFGLEKEDISLEQRPRVWTTFIGREFLHQKVGRVLYSELKTQGFPFAEMSFEDSDNRSFLCRRVEAYLGDKVSALDQFEPCRVPLEKEVESTKKTRFPDSILMCNSCHNGGKEAVSIVAPYIPFLKRDELSKNWRGRILSRLNKSEEGSMPPNRNLMQRERTEIENYLKIE